MSQSFSRWPVSVCGGRLSAKNKVEHLYSHAKYGDQNYNNKEDCDWVVSASPDHYRVRLHFLTFEVEDETDCGWVDSWHFDSVMKGAMLETNNIGSHKHLCILWGYATFCNFSHMNLQSSDECVCILDHTLQNTYFTKYMHTWAHTLQNWQITDLTTHHHWINSLVALYNWGILRLPWGLLKTPSSIHLVYGQLDSCSDM